MTSLPEWIWNPLSFLCVLAGLAIVLLYEPIYKRLKYRRTYPYASKLIILISLFVVLFSGWLFFIFKPKFRIKNQAKHDPNLRIEHNTFVKSKNDKFSLLLVNSGLSDVENIEFFEDLFVSVKIKKEKLKMIRFGKLLTIANSKISKLESKEKKYFTISLPKEVYKEMKEFRYTQKKKAFLVMFFNILIKYRRIADGQSFSMSKLFVITLEDSPRLTSFDNLKTIGPKMTLKEVKQAIKDHPYSHK